MLTPLFTDRYDAGLKLSTLLQKYKDDKNTLLLALPRGGVITAYALAKELFLPLDVIVPRKIGAPFQKELAIGAICENFSIFNQELIDAYEISTDYIESEIEIESQKAAKRLATYRKGKKPLELKGKTIIIVDDGIATGSTMTAAIKAVKNYQPKRLLVAIPVGPKETLDEIEPLVDKIYAFATPTNFMAVGQFYESFPQVEDVEIFPLLHPKEKKDVTGGRHHQ